MGSRYAGVAAELVEWREDVTGRGIGSQVVVLEVARGWGRSALLEQLAGDVESCEPVTLVARVSGVLPPGSAAQAAQVAAEVAKAWQTPRDPESAARAARLLGLDTAAGKAQLGLGLAGLFVPGGMAAQVAGLLASLGVTAAENAWDGSLAGEQGLVARAARRLARLSVSVPAVCVIDDADYLDPALAMVLVRGLAGRADGQVLVVVAAAPESGLAAALTRDPGPDLAGRVHRAEADPKMGYADRAQLAAELLPAVLPGAAERVARRTVSFDQVRQVAASARVTELTSAVPLGDAVAAVDAAADAVLERGEPSGLAVVLAWAGGALHARQIRRAMGVLGGGMHEGRRGVAWAGQVARLAAPEDGDLRIKVGNLSKGQRSELAAVLLSEAAALAGNSEAGVIERVIARQAAHNVRGDLLDRAGLAEVQVALIEDLEALGDSSAARRIAATAWGELNEPAAEPGDDDTARRQLLAAELRLARVGGSAEQDPAVRQAVDLALSGGASISLEARVWAAVDLLRWPGQRHNGLALGRQVASNLDDSKAAGELARQWRLTLAFHAGEAGDTALAQQLLAPLLRDGPEAARDAAAAVLRAAGGPHAATRLQIVFLQAELEATPADDDEELQRLHLTLSCDHGTLGEYWQALLHRQHELSLLRRLRGDDHPATLAARRWIAHWTGECGDFAGALTQCREVLPDLVRVEGPDRQNTLAARRDVALWTERSGDTAGALALCQELLPDQVRVLGRDHPITLTARKDIADWTGECGNPAEALALCQELLPDLVWVLGPDNTVTLSTRAGIARWTGECGNPAVALALCRELLPDKVRVSGPDHPDTLAIRQNITFWTARSGDTAAALAQCRELLPDVERVLGPDHPNALVLRQNIADWVAEGGNPAEAVALYEKLLPDLIQILGPDCLETIRARLSHALSTVQCGDLAKALTLCGSLLPDMDRLLGADDLITLKTREMIAAIVHAAG